MANTPQNYWKYYGMSHDPFSEDIDFAVSYVSLQAKKYIDFLADLDSYKNTVVLVTGEPGVGKTTLLYRLLDHLPEEVHYHVLHGKDCRTALQLLEEIQKKFGAPIERDINLTIYDQANQQLTYLQQDTQHYLLIIDEADKLPLEVQQILLHFVQQQLVGHVVLQIIMFGESSLVAAMEQIASHYKPEESEHIVNNLILAPFSHQEMVSYLEQRFDQAGLSDEFPLNNDDLEYVFKKTHGVAQQVNKFTESLLRGHFMKKRQPQQEHETKTPLLQRYIWWVCTIAVIAVLLIWVLPLFESKSQEDQQMQPLSLPVDQHTDQDQSMNNPNPDYNQPQNTQQQLQDASQNPPAMQDDMSNDNGQGEEQNMSTQPAAPAVVKPQPVAQPAMQAEPMNVESAPVKPHKIKAKPKAAARPALTSVEKQLLKIDRRYYTIQLVASFNKADIANFLAHHQLQNEAVYFHTYLNHKSWYVVISGDYATYSEAREAINKLPPDLQALHPWARSFGSVHKAIKMGS